MARQKSRRGGALIEAKNAVRGSLDAEGNIGPAVAFARSRLSPSQYPDFVRWLKGIGPHGRDIWKGRATGIEELVPDMAPVPASLERELAWAAALLQTESELLRQFVSWRDKIQQAVLSGNFPLAERLLDQMEQATGASLWLIEARIAVLQRSKGLEGQKAYVRSLNERHPNGFAAVVGYHVSGRNEDSATANRFTSTFLSSLDKWSIPMALKDYLSFRVVGRSPPSPSRLSSVLAIASMLSAVDLYTAFTEVVHVMTGHSFGSVNGNRVANSVRMLSPIGDSTLLNAIAFFDKDFALSLLPSFQRVANTQHLLEGDYDRAQEAALAFLKQTPGDVSAVVSLARAAALSGIAQLSYPEIGLVRNEILELVLGAFNKERGYFEAVSNLQKLSLNWRPLPFSQTIRKVTDYELSLHSFDAGIAFAGSSITDHSPQALSVGVLSRGVAVEMVTRLEAQYGHSAEVSFTQAALGLGTAQDGLSHEAVQIADIVHRTQAQDFVEALAITQDLTKLVRPALRKELSRIEAFLLLETNRLGDALDLIATAYISNPGLVRTLPLDPLDRLLSGSVDFVDTFGAFTANISTSIALHIYNRSKESDSVQALVRAAWDEYLYAHNVSRPTELLEQDSEIDADYLLYFLRYVCVPSVMDVSTTFSSSEEITEERIAICSALISLDKVHREVYEQEIVQLTKQLRVQQGRRQFDMSRLHVDREGLAAWALREFEEQYNRYVDLVLAGISESEREFDSSAVDWFKHGTPLPAKYLEVPKGEGDQLLLDIVHSLHDAFLFSPVFGLDGFLSMRIRHGTFSGQLRSPLEERSLVTSRESSGHYADNRYWPDVSPNLSDRKRGDLQNAFAEFSSNFDTLIADVVQDRIQVRNVKKPNGALYSTMSPVVLHGLKIFAGKGISFEEFVGNCIEVFWLSLRPSLEKFRAYLQTELKPQLIQVIFGLESRVSGVLDAAERISLRAAIASASTGLQVALDEATSWFDERGLGQMATYTFEEVVDIARETSITTHGGRQLDINVYDCGEANRINSPSATQLIDILLIGLDNVYVHSGIPKSPKVAITLGPSDESGNAELSIVSETAPAARSESVGRKLEHIRALAESGEYDDLVSQEGGTGLLKLCRIMREDGDDNRRVAFGFEPNGDFGLIVTLRMFLLQRELTDSG